MPRKKTPPITKDEAIISAINHFLHEVHKNNVSDAIGYVFAMISKKDVRIREVSIKTVPSEEYVRRLILDGFDIKAKYVIFTIWSPKSDEDIQSLDIITYSKDEKTLSKSPFRIVENKLVPVQRQEKGFGIFMEEDDG